MGQQHVIQTLRNAVVSERVAHAYLFSGPRGTGKTTAARLLAKAVNCLAESLADRPCNQCAHCLAVNENRFLDLIEIDAASNTSVDDVRDLRDKINFSPSQGRFKVYIIDEVHMLSTAAFNALLKTLEEPPPHAIFVLATTEIHKIPATVLSRCQRHEFRRVPVEEIVTHLKAMVESEGFSVEKEALTMIARQATGSLRDAISLLDQLASTGQEISLDLAQTVLGTAANQSVLALIDAILDEDPAAGLQEIHRALDAGTDPRAFARQVVDYLRALLLIKLGNGDQVDATRDVRDRMAKHALRTSAPDLLRLIQAFNAAATDLHGGWQPALGLEMAFAGSLERKPAPEPDQPTSGTPKKPARAFKVVEQEEPPAAEKPAPKKKPQAAEPEQPEKVEKKQAGKVGLNEIVQAWKQIRDVIRPEYPSVDGLLNSCKPLEVKDGVLVLGFRAEVVRSKMDKPEHLEVARKAIQHVLGHDLGIRCVVADTKGKAPADIDQNGMVAAALHHGGEIVDIH